MDQNRYNRTLDAFVSDLDLSYRNPTQAQYFNNNSEFEFKIGESRFFYNLCDSNPSSSSTITSQNSSIPLNKDRVIEARMDTVYDTPPSESQCNSIPSHEALHAREVITIDRRLALCHNVWFFPTMDRLSAQKLLSCFNEPGNFIVRASSSPKDGLTVTYVHTKGIFHHVRVIYYPVDPSVSSQSLPRYGLTGSKLFFLSIPEMIAFYFNAETDLGDKLTLNQKLLSASESELIRYNDMAAQFWFNLGYSKDSSFLPEDSSTPANPPPTIITKPLPPSPSPRLSRSIFPSSQTPSLPDQQTIPGRSSPSHSESVFINKPLPDTPPKKPFLPKTYKIGHKPQFLSSISVPPTSSNQNKIKPHERPQPQSVTNLAKKFEIKFEATKPVIGKGPVKPSPQLRQNQTPLPKSVVNNNNSPVDVAYDLPYSSIDEPSSESNIPANRNSKLRRSLSVGDRPQAETASSEYHFYSAINQATKSKTNLDENEDNIVPPTPPAIPKEFITSENGQKDWTASVSCKRSENMYAVPSKDTRQSSVPNLSYSPSGGYSDPWDKSKLLRQVIDKPSCSGPSSLLQTSPTSHYALVQTSVTSPNSLPSTTSPSSATSPGPSQGDYEYATAIIRGTLPATDTHDDSSTIYSMVDSRHPTEICSRVSDDDPSEKLNPATKRLHKRSQLLDDVIADWSKLTDEVEEDDDHTSIGVEFREKMLPFSTAFSTKMGKSIRLYVYSLATNTATLFSQQLQAFIECTRNSQIKNPHVIMRNVRQFINGMKNLLMQNKNPELKKVIDSECDKLTREEFLNLDALLETALIRLIVMPLREHIKSLLIGEHQNTGTFLRMSRSYQMALTKSAEELGVKPQILPPNEDDQKTINSYFDKMEKCYSPLKKLEYLLSAIRLIYSTMRDRDTNDTTNPAKVGAEDFLPIFVFVLTRCRFLAAEMEAEYIEGLLQADLLTGEGGYYLTSLQSAIQIIKSLGAPASLNAALNKESDDDPQGVIRVVILDESTDNVISKTFPLSSSTTAKSLCNIISKCLNIFNPQDYGLFQFAHKLDMLLDDNENLYQLKERHQAKIGKPCVFLYRRRNVYFALPHNFK